MNTLANIRNAGLTRQRIMQQMRYALCQQLIGNLARESIDLRPQLQAAVLRKTCTQDHTLRATLYVL